MLGGLVDIMKIVPEAYIVHLTGNNDFFRSPKKHNFLPKIVKIAISDAIGSNNKQTTLAPKSRQERVLVLSEK